MKVNVNHPSFVTFLDSVNNNILSNITINTYFSLSNEKKIGVQYMVLKLMKNSVKVRAKLTDNELKSFLIILRTKNVESENYEFAEILKDISNNFEKINSPEKILIKRTIKTVKTDSSKNE